MPRLNGPRAAQEIRSLGYDGIIVGITGKVLSEDVRDFIDHGADIVLGKPFDMNDFKLRVTEQQMKRRRASFNALGHNGLAM